jgi:hypothetical protein
MSRWRHQIEIGVWALVIAGLIVWVSTQENSADVVALTAQQLQNAVTANQVDALQTKGLQLQGTFTSQAKNIYHTRRFKVTEPLPQNIYELMLTKNLSAYPFLGPVAEMQRPESAETWLKDLQPAKSPETSTQTLYVSALGVEAGSLSLTQELVEHRKFGEFVKVTIEAISSATFSGVYAIRDRGEVYIHRSSGIPWLEHLQFNESDQAGAIWHLQLPNQPPTQIKQLYRRRGAKQFDSAPIEFSEPLQFVGSVLNFVQARIDPRHTQNLQIHLFDLNEVQEIRVRTTPGELTTATVAVGEHDLPLTLTFKGTPPHHINSVRVQTPLGWVEAKSL